MSKRPLGHGDIRGMKDFKAAAADYAYYLTLGDEGRLYCLTDRQIYCLLVQLDYVGWLTRWYNTADITQTTVGFIRSELEEALLSCVDVSILVDQANENLITAVTNRAIQSQTLRDAYEAEYDGNPTSINPDAPTTTFSYSGTSDGQSALCAALMAFVYQAARAQADSVRAGQVGGLAAIGLIAALLIPGLNIFFLAGAAIAVLAGAGIVGVTTEVAIQALTDTDALDEVVCCMRDNLDGADVSAASWAAALGGCGFAGGSHAQIVADFLGATLADNYLPFLDLIGTGKTGVTNGETLPECDSCTDDNCYRFVLGLDGFNDSGNYVPEQGFRRDDYRSRPDRLTTRRDLPDQLMTKVTVTFNQAFNGSIAIRSHTQVDLQTITANQRIWVFSAMVGASRNLPVAIDVRSVAPASLPDALRLTDICIEY